MKKILTLAIGLFGATSLWAVPQLQLDIAGGSYDNSSGTIVANGNPFTLYALYDAGRGTPSGSFYISASIIPQTDAGSFGSFSINGTSYSSASGMQYGTPPLDTMYPGLEGHGVFPTYFAEIEFTFDDLKRAGSYDSQLNRSGFVSDVNGTLVYEAFTVNVAGLSAGSILHFDLYNTFGRRDIGLYETSFAPFTHDAESGVNIAATVPDAGATLALLASGLMGCVVFSRKFGQVA